MPSGHPYLVIQRDDGYGDVFPLDPAERYTLGRAQTCRIVLKDELCSREHAEVYFADDQWHVRDLSSLNGTRLNGQVLTRDTILAPHDEIRAGKTRLLFLEKLPGVPASPKSPLVTDQSVSIRKRLGDTQKYQKLIDPQSTGEHNPEFPRERVEVDLARLYQLALGMGEVDTIEELAGVVINGLLDAVPADVGAVLTVRDDRELELLAYKTRNPNQQTYHKVSSFISSEALNTRQAILAEDVTTHELLKGRDSLSELHASSLICAPVRVEGRIFALVHLYGGQGRRPLDNDDLEFVVAAANQFAVAVSNIRKRERIAAENRVLREQIQIETELVGQSKPITDILSQIGRVAATNATVLIRGESGVGKELVARAIHLNSPRKDGPFVCLNCAALTETLLESELFGHERGAFTGATEKMIGKFEAANHGTIFLDEIGEMAVGTQAKFLRVLEGHAFERVGGNTPIKVDVRVVAATNQPLEAAVQAGRFRKDLFFRLQVVEFRVPPLRERPSDIPLLADHFLKRFSRETGRKIRGFTAAAMKKLETYAWPGNVRELRNVVERAVALGSGPTLDADDILLSHLPIDDQRPVPGAYRELTIADLEKEHIAATLEHTAWNKSQAASILGIERSTLDRKIKGYEIGKK
jgi:Nif-specific regulatory protein